MKKAKKYEEKQYWFVIIYCHLICLDELINSLSRKAFSEMKFVIAVFRCASDQNYAVEFDYLTLI
jgi:hypothetical protein